MSVTFKQYKGAWASNPYPTSTYTMSVQGCGPTSIANILANSINPSITPKEVGQYMRSKGYAVANAGSTWDGMTRTLRFYNISCTDIYKPNSSTLWSHLNKGNRWVIFLFGGGTQGGVTWTAGGHFIAATGYKIKDGKHWFYMRDSGQRNNDGWFCYEDTMSTLLVKVWICTSEKQSAKFKVDDIPANAKVETNVSTAASNVPETDTGVGLNLQQQVSKLYSSDNYTFISANKSETSKSTSASKLKDALSNISKPLTESSASEILALGTIASRNAIAIALDTLLDDTEDSIPKSNPKTTQKGELLSYQTVVEAPVIILNLNGVIIGGYGNLGDVYPNYITSMTVNKISGKINQYTINLVYTVRFGEDPNFIDKLLSHTGFTNKIQILYGDSNGSKLFRDDEAIITDVTFNESVSSKTISYTITALSSIISVVSMTNNYSSKTAKPSTLINDLLYSPSEQSTALLNALPGMKSRTLVNSNRLIPNNDSVITTQTRLNASPASQLSYYVSGMYNEQNNSTYYLTYMDDTKNEYGGPYIKITELGETSTEALAGNYFEIDVGYPGQNFVMNFTLNNDVYFPLIYDYNDKFTRWNYDIDNMGRIIKTKENPLITNNPFKKRNVIQANWWKQVTEYPVSAQITLKGLVKPILITSYIKVNVLFYGNYDLASGLYVVTGQTDSISGSGYTTTLSLLRVGN